MGAGSSTQVSPLGGRYYLFLPSLPPKVYISKTWEWGGGQKGPEARETTQGLY